MGGKESIKKVKLIKVIDIITWAIFLLSFVPYLVLVKAALFGADVGLFHSYMAYGFDAVYTLIGFFTMVPIFPVCLIYEILYVIVRFRKLGKIRRRVTIAIPVTIAILVFVPCTIYSIVDNSLDKKYYRECEGEIWDYLRDHYSDEMLENGELTLNDREDGHFLFRLDKGLFDHIYYIDIYRDEDGNIRDDFTENFSGSNVYNKDFQEAFNEYVDEFYGVDTDMDLYANILAVDMREFCYQDDVSALFEKCEYTVDSVYIRVDEYDQDVVISKIKDFRKNVIPQLPLQDEQNFNYIVVMNDRFHASIHSYDKDVNDDEMTLFISGYTYTSEEGATVPSVNVDVTLD